MSIFDVKLVSYNKEQETYTFEYCIFVKENIYRKRKVTYYKGKLSRDYDNKELVSTIKKLVREHSD